MTLLEEIYEAAAQAAPCGADEELLQRLCRISAAQWQARLKAGVTPESEGKRIIFQKLYEREWEEARERAVTDAMETFNLCPICRRLVCNRCFLLGEDIDLCADCARNLQERGEPVTPKEESG